MKRKIFGYEIRLGVWLLATARIVDNRCYVNWCYADNINEVDTKDVIRLDVTDIKLWCEKNDAILWAY